MAIYGIGAHWGNEGDVTKLFIDKNVACIGWSVEDVPSLHKLMRHIKVGDIIYGGTAKTKPLFDLLLNSYL